MKIAVLYGGNSTEREVSLVSGRAVATALQGRGHDVLLVDPARGDAPVGPAETVAAIAITGSPPAVLEEEGSALRAVSGSAVSAADVVFVALHGGTGEDGTVQGLLELAGKRYTGSGVLSCALAMDKRVSKILFREAGVATPAWRVVRGAFSADGGAGAPLLPGDLPAAAGAVAELGGFPLVVKPNDQGSTVGLTIVERSEGLDDAVARAAAHSSRVLLESYVPGREVTVAVLEDRALPVVEIEPRNGLYDYESKYTAGMSEYTCPADIPESVERELQQQALDAFASLGCSGYARVDFRLTTEMRPFCLEVNTVPGMTDTSLVPMAAKAAGMTFEELVERIVQLALGGAG